MRLSSKWFLWFTMIGIYVMVLGGIFYYNLFKWTFDERLKQEAAARITQLNERIKELNQRLMGTTGANQAAPGPPPSGFFKR